MKKVFIAYRFTGEDYKTLKKVMSGICDALLKRGFKIFCSIDHEKTYRVKKYTRKQIFDHSLPELDSADFLFAFINSDSRSEGLLIEMGYALAKGKPIILAVRKGVDVHSSKAVANQVLEFEDYPELNRLISDLKF